MTSPQSVTRRSANYDPMSWSQFLQSLHASYACDHHDGSVGDDKLQQKISKLEKEVAASFAADAMKALPLPALLELVDDIQQLGLGYRFERELVAALDYVSSKREDVLARGELHVTALLFRLLRDNRYDVSQDIFFSFLDENNNFNPVLCESTKGWLSLYEASYYGYEDEHILDKARAFTLTKLKALVEGQQLQDSPEKKKALHALELPIRWRMPRLQVRWYINVCSGQQASSYISLLNLAKLDFVRLQHLHQKELTEVSRWWRTLGLMEKLPFTRDRVVELFFIAVGMLPEPRFGHFRVQVTKIFAVLVVLDDLYDIYGSVDELELFTEALQRWDLESAVQTLPEYMKSVYLALFNQVNEVAHDALKHKGMDVVRCLKRKCTELCKAFLLETKWHHRCYTPTLEEYLENGWMSTCYPMVLPYICILAGEAGQQEALELLASNVDLVRWNSVVCRLVNDMATSEHESKRGEVANALQCYIYHDGVSEKEARARIQVIVDKAWKVINWERFRYGEKLPTHLADAAINLTRAMHCIYRYSDGVGFPSKISREQVASLLVEGIPGVDSISNLR